MLAPSASPAPLVPAVVDAYLARVGHGPVGAPSLAALASLQDAHVRAVPFENLDIHLGRALSLDLAHLAAKVVADHRGGFCYELNGLFCALLRTLGYDAWLVEARGLRDDGSLGARFDHARILVRVGADDPVLVDVGTGVSPRGPVRLEATPQRIGDTWYRVTQAEGRYVSERYEDGTWARGWCFDTVPRMLEDFRDRCRHHEHSPESDFTGTPLCTLVTEDGHRTLSDRRLITCRGGTRVERQIDDPLTVLHELFGIRLPRWPHAG